MGMKCLESSEFYDCNGKKIVDKEVVDILEPYDPAYVFEGDSEDSNPCKISAYEKRFFRKVSILQNKLRKEKIKYEWLHNWQCFRIWKYTSDYPTYMYLRVNIEENDYSFGTESEDWEYSGRVSVIIDAAINWLNEE